jgi:hypothetical protein
MDEFFIEEKSSMDRLLDLLVFLAVFAVTIFLILEIVAGSGSTSLDIVAINEIYFYINIIVFIIFFVDLIRLWKEADGAKDFFSHSWLDILATIPFGLLAAMFSTIAPGSAWFQILKWTRFSKLSNLGKAQKISRVSKISKQFKAASHLKKEGEEYQKKHRL